MFHKRIILATCLIVMVAAQFSAISADKRKPSVLFIGSHGGRCSYQIANQLQKSGFAVNAMKYPGLAANPLTWNDVKKYNVVVVGGLGKSNADMTLSENNEISISTLKKFLATGGGVLMLGNFGQQATMKPPQDAFLKPLGLTPLFDEMTVSPSDCEVGTSWNIPFAYTANIANSPITSDVKGIWYPAPEKRTGAQNHMITFTCDKQWTIALKGGKKSLTRKGPLQDVAPKGKGTYDSEVPLTALRQVGSGRIVYFGITPEYLFGTNAYTTLEGVVLKRGLLGKPSDGYLLIENTLKWLSEPSLSSGALGGAEMNKEMLRNPNMLRHGKPFQWSTKTTFPPRETAYPGVIGARTKYSTGTTTVKKWIEAAKKEKLSFIVFLEDFKNLTKAEFESLKKECAALSSPRLALIPGFTIDDEVGNHYFYFGTTFAYPDKNFLSPNGKTFVSDDPELDPKKPKAKGQLAMTTLNYAYTKNSFKQTCGNFLYSKDSAPFANFFSNWDATGVVTSVNGKLMEDATKEYLELVDFGQGPLPLAITLMDSPEQIKKSDWRTILSFPANNAKTVDGFTLKAATKIQDYFNQWHFYPDNPARIHVSSGPEIAYWGYVGPRDYGGDNKGNFVWQSYRWKLKGIVNSKVGLKEVAVYDGPALFRLFRPLGKKEFTFILDLTHDKQHNLVVVATDIKGGKAVSGEQWDRNHRLEEFNCADRNNQLSYGMIERADGTGIKLGGNQTLATPNKRIAPKSVSPSGTFRNDSILGTPAFDGGTGGEPVVYAPVMMREKGKETYSPSVSESLRLFDTGDVNVGEGRWDHFFTDNIRVANVWHTLWKTEPAKKFTVVKRNHFFVPDPDSPLAVFLWNIKITLKRNCPDSEFLIAHMNPRKSRIWAMRGENGMVLGGNWEATAKSAQRRVTLPFGPGAYVTCLDSGLGGAAVFSLTEGLTMTTSLPGKNRIAFNLPKGVAPTKKGETKNISLLIVGIPRMTKYNRGLPAKTNEVVERFRSDFGFSGKPAYKVDIKGGSVTDSKYILEIDGAKDKCFSGVISGKLISTLPIRVSGLDDNKSAFLYDEKLKQARPIGVFEGKAWATVIVNGSRNLFIGQPVTASETSLVIQLTQATPTSWSLEVHNPTSKTIETTVEVNKFFPPLKGVEIGKLTIPSGTSIHKTLKQGK